MNRVNSDINNVHTGNTSPTNTLDPRDRQRQENAKAPSMRVRGADLQGAIYHPRQETMEEDDVPEDNTLDILVFTLLGKEDGFVDEYGNHMSMQDEAGYPALFDRYDEKTKKIVPAESVEEAYAQLTTKQRQSKYYVKRGPDGRMYDPMGMFNQFDRSKLSNSVRDGRKIWKFAEVDRDTFFAYLNFLKHKNQAHLVRAQRGIV